MGKGGARAGAGRPKGSKNRIPAEGRKTLFKSIEKGMSVSRYIIDRCLG